MSTSQADWVTAAPRILGWVTFAYSAALLVRPEILGKPCGYVTATGELPRPVKTLINAVGARDAASGLAMALAPRGTPLRIAIGVRVAADFSDAAIFAVGLRERDRAMRIAGFAGLWGTACALSAKAA